MIIYKCEEKLTGEECFLCDECFHGNYHGTDKEIIGQGEVSRTLTAWGIWKNNCFDCGGVGRAVLTRKSKICLTNIENSQGVRPLKIIEEALTMYRKSLDDTYRRG